MVNISNSHWAYIMIVGSIGQPVFKSIQWVDSLNNARLGHAYTSKMKDFLGITHHKLIDVNLDHGHDYAIDLIMGCMGPHIITEVVSKLADIKKAVDATRPTTTDGPPPMAPVILPREKPMQAKSESSSELASAVKPTYSAQCAPKRKREEGATPKSKRRKQPGRKHEPVLSPPPFRFTRVEAEKDRDQRHREGLVRSTSSSASIMQEFSFANHVAMQADLIYKVESHDSQDSQMDVEADNSTFQPHPPTPPVLVL